MTDIFVSYAREDEGRVVELVSVLEQQGWSVFWDRRIPSGETWRSYIGRALDGARCVIVAWSRNSVNSTWVIEEADEGKRRGILVPVLLDPVEQPRGFREIQAADLTEWEPGHSSLRLDELVEDIRLRLRRAPALSHDGPPTVLPAAQGVRKEDRILHGSNGTPKIPNRKRTERQGAVAFGIFFLLLLIVLAVAFPEPTIFQYTVFRIVLALAASGVATMITGFIEVDVSNIVRAGGALAVFVIVYFFSPAQLVSTAPKPQRTINFIANGGGPFAVKGRFRGKAIVSAKEIRIEIEEGTISFPVRAPDGGDRYIESVSAVVACNAEGSWAEASQSRSLSLNRKLMVGKAENLGRFKLTIPRPDRDISDCWLVFAIAVKTSPQEQNAGFSYAHTQRDLFQTDQDRASNDNALESPLEAKVTLDAGTYDAVQLIRLLNKLTGGIILDPSLETKLASRSVIISTPLKDVSLRALLDLIFDQLEFSVDYRTENETVIIAEKEGYP